MAPNEIASNAVENRQNLVGVFLAITRVYSATDRVGCQAYPGANLPVVHLVCHSRVWMEERTQDRREHRRIPVQVNVRIEFTGQEFNASSANLSAGGVFLETERRLPPGTRVRLRFTVPIIAKYPIRAEGEVVWVGGDQQRGLAVRFVEIGEEDRALLGELAEQFDSLIGEA